MTQTHHTPSTHHFAPGQRWLLAACVFVAVALTALSVSAVFRDMQWLPQMLLSVGVILLSGAIFRSLPHVGASGLAVLVEFIVGVWVVMVVCVPGSMLLDVIPTFDSAASLFDLMGRGINDIYSTTAPVASTSGLVALLTVGLSLLAMLIDGLVSDLHLPKPAAVLVIATYLIPVFVAPQSLQWWHFVCAGAAFVLVLLTPYTNRASSRGPLGALVAGALALVLGVGVPLLTPPIQAGQTPPLSGAKDLTIVNPFLDLKADLGEQSRTQVMTYTTDDPLTPPIRLTSVSDFDGRTWKPATFELDTAARADSALPNPDGLSGQVNTTSRTFTARMGDVDEQYLPSPYAPATTNGLNAQWIYDAQTLTIVGNGTTAKNLDYRVGYTSVEPTAEQLDSASPVQTSEFKDELALPRSTPSIIEETARDVTKGTSTQWQKASALQKYLRSDRFTYSLEAPKEASGDSLADFLRDRRGYCVQFSGAMTAMARSLGIPARIAVGFAPGTPTGEDTYSVTMEQAHAWPELYFNGVGWVRFEPTPGGPAGTPPPWTEASRSDPAATATAQPTESGQEQTTEAAAPTSEPSETAEATPEASAQQQAGGGIPWRGILLVAGIVLVVLLLALPGLLRTRQRSNRLADPLDAQRVWWEIRAVLIDYGRPADPAHTVRTQSGALSALVSGDEREALQRLTTLVEVQRYRGSAPDAPLTGSAAGEPRSVSSEEARELVKSLRTALAKQCGVVAGLSAVVLPRSLFVREQRTSVASSAKETAAV